MIEMAEWAQARKQLLHTPMQRGYWYQVEGSDDFVRVRIPGLADYPPIDKKFLRIIDYEPNMITRIQTTAPDGENATITYYGVCPRHHHIDHLRVSHIYAACLDCRKSYPVEAEAQLGGQK